MMYAALGTVPCTTVQGLTFPSVVNLDGICVRCKGCGTLSHHMEESHKGL